MPLSDIAGVPLLWRDDNSGDRSQRLIRAMPVSLQASAAGIKFAADGEVIVGPEFRMLEAAWIEGIAAMARAGCQARAAIASPMSLTPITRHRTDMIPALCSGPSGL
jgi:Chloramphenicol phosphotransferase-like protein